MEKLAVLFLSLNLLGTFGERSVFVDLSHQPQSSAGTFSRAIVETVRKSGVSEQRDVEIDLSSSSLGDDGMKIVSETLLPNETSASLSNATTFHLSTRMNRLSPFGVATLMKRIKAQSLNSTARKESDLRKVDSLDLGWNNLNVDLPGSKDFLASLRMIVSDPTRCPRILRFDQCGLAPAVCRSIGKGIINRFESEVMNKNHLPLLLHLCGNEAIGDAGVAALAAALRTSLPQDEKNVLDTLDVSSCNVGDSGAEAIAMALHSNPNCVRHLDLSNNKISDEGAVAIASALAQVPPETQSLVSLDMSNNKNIGDHGATALASVLKQGKIHSLSLRSCHIHADGAQAFGEAIASLSELSSIEASGRRIDLSGNPIGILRGKSKGNGKYSATKLRSKASATASSYMNFIGKNIRSGLRDVGLDLLSSSNGPSAESDDDEEERMGIDGVGGDVDPSKARCGAKALASGIMNDGNEQQKQAVSRLVPCELAMRHCFLDQSAADALAAAVLRSRDYFGVSLSVDVRMNPVLESEMVEALKGEAESMSTLEVMADRHKEALDILRESRQRAKEATEASRKRVVALDEEWEGDDEFGFGGVGYNNYDDYDSDAIYDDPNNSDY